MIEAVIIADSVNADTDDRIITYKLTYPRFIHCFDKETEVLTRVNGVIEFRLWQDVVNTDCEIAAYHTDEHITFEKPLSWIQHIVKEKLIGVDNQRISMLVTQGHRLYVGSRKAKGDEWEIIKASELLNDFTQKRLTTYGFYEGKDIGKLAQLIGFFIGDGWLSCRTAGFHLRKTRKIQYIESLLRELNIHYTKTVYKDGCVNIKTKSYIDIFQDCYTTDGKKKIPLLIHDVNSKSFLMLLDGLFYSDGSTDKEYLKTFNTSSKHVADTLSTLACVHGLHINIKGRYKNGMYKLTNCVEKQPVIRTDKIEIKQIDYQGPVYCASVSTGLLLVRRHGMVHVSGNCEIMTHRVFSRNAASSRAIPIEKMISFIRDNPAGPVYWGKNQKGMQAGEELSIDSKRDAEQVWLDAAEHAIKHAEKLIKLGVHKQIANRLLEPWAHMITLVTATEWGNFFNLRCHPEAQPEFQELAYQMLELYVSHEPLQKEVGQWHLPFADKYLEEDLSIEDLLQICTARAARVSYMNFEGNIKHEKDYELHARLLSSGHWSPFEHAALAYDKSVFCGNLKGWKPYRKQFSNENKVVFNAEQLLANRRGSPYAEK